MAAVYRELIAHQNRAGHVVSDVVAALKRGRLCMVLTQWRDHVDDFQWPCETRASIRWCCGAA